MSIHGPRLLEEVQDWFQTELLQQSSTHALSKGSCSLVMDNASIHNPEKVRDLIEGSGALLVYTAPYSPEYNPIEYMFGEYKKALKRHSYHSGYNWSAGIKRVLLQ
jgi:transposase